MNIYDLETPALLLDLDIFESNVSRMADHVARSGKKLRAHAKAHKCVPIAKRQIASGAVGVCVATVNEAELMVKAGIPGILVTSPVAHAGKCRRIAALASIAPDLMVAVDHQKQVAMYAEACSAKRVKLNMLIDLDVGDHRTGITPGIPALHLARTIVDQPSLSLRGLQAYSVKSSHLPQEEGRAEFSAAAMSQAEETRRVLEEDGIHTDIISGGSSGSYAGDLSLPYFTELQAGSYPLMDVAYSRIGGVDFGHALTVLATVVSANQADRVTVDAGFKAFATDRPFGPEPLDLPGVRYTWAGDEFGHLFFSEGQERTALGERVRFIPPHCDPTVNLYDRIHVCRGDQVEDIWAVMDRYES